MGEAQPRTAAALARRHLEDGCLVLYDLTSSWIEGRCCELARFGYRRDGKRKVADRARALVHRRGLPIVVEVFAGDTADPATLAAQIAELKQRFRLARVVLVADRG